MAQTVDMAVAELKAKIVAIVPLVAPGRRFLPQDSSDDTPAVGRSFAVWAREDDGVDECIGETYTVAWIAEIVFRTAPGEDIGATRRNSLQDVVQVIGAIARPPMTLADPWISCTLVGRSIYEDDTEHRRSLRYRIVQDPT